ncbi:ClpP family protease [Zunongwangia sp.]|uniref:ClpP family protease n=1 Tax=Zunongwangia sp. TaxID=1965325 RepID=UPI003AA9222B
MKGKRGKIQDKIDARFLEKRKIFMWGPVDEKSAKHVIDRLLYLDLEGKEEIQLYISSAGGYITDGFAIYDTIQEITAPVSTICSGLAASIGAILLSAGKKGRRFIQPHAKVMIQQPSGGTNGQASNIEIQATEIIKTKEISAEILAENCNHSVQKIMKDFNRDYWMSAQESLAYGIVDNILK